MKQFPNKFFDLCVMYFKIFKWKISLFLILITLAIFLENMNIRIFADIIGALKEANSSSYNNALYSVYLLIGCGVLTIFFKYYGEYFFNAKILVSCKQLMNVDLFEYLLGHSYEYITNKQSGLLITYLKQVTNLPELLETAIWVLRFILDILIKIVLLFFISPIIGACYLCFNILIFLWGRLFVKVVSKIGKLSSKIKAIAHGRMLDTVNNIDVVKQFDNIENEKKSLNILLKQHYIIAIKSINIFLRQFSSTGIISSIFSFILIVIAVYLWSKGNISTADVTYILMIQLNGLHKISAIIDGVQHITKDIATIEKGLEVFAEPHGIVDKKGAKKLNVLNGKIEFKNVCFTYKNKKKPVFDKFNFIIKAGEKVGIVGASGCGKTTLVNLLQRSFELNSGQILIDDIDITDVTQESLHQNISIIPQDTVMFNRSIFQNIVFGTNIKDINIVRKASKKAYADDFILEKDGGYSSYAGDRGCKLSGGERQRLAIARAILKDAPILILDEATSSLDTQSEQQINKAIENVIQNQTVIAIAHRLSTLKSMDRIIVIEKGKIIEEGTFDQLLALGGKFKRLYLAQQKKRGGKNA